MASVSISSMILFIASILIAASVVGVFTDSIDQMSQAIEDRGVSVSENIRTDIEIISDSGSTAVYDEPSNNVTIHVKNTGSKQLRDESEAIDVFVDGRYQTTVNTTLLGDASTWDTGDVAKLEISPDTDLSSGDHRVKVIVNEDEEVFRFRT